MEFITVSSNQDDQNITFSAHPNPFTAQLIIDSGVEFIQLYTVYASEGRVVQSKEDIHAARIVFDSEKWSAGVYFVRVTTPSLTSTVRVLRVE